MKTNSIALVLATATSAPRGSHPYLEASGAHGAQRRNLHHQPPADCPQINLNDTKRSYRSIGMAGNKTYNCTDKAYQLHLPNGIYNVDHFDFGVSRADGSATGRATLKDGGGWKCKKQEAPLEQCNWDGTFYLDVVPSGIPSARSV
ncbi:uncharacterized protein N7515_009588 [Penicillium bovifimosum]|uniref:Uncharacterized protein n=1 Tax=Penicillium bovifimosum TaxID=126998 RepID=A0A9W9KVN7_9EURO|nr:uncharacterized protein N7515_009588 [Penicillium bovifimosum]KAJ5121627.1 hypothetical protein N7515_009588 [Penicillium bovifimosum]